MTFKEYLAGRKAGFDAKGDFVRLARADAGMPDVSTWGALKTYVEKRHGYEAAEAGRLVWGEYEATMRGVDKRRIMEGWKE